MGAKNHAVVLPDANLDATVNALTGAAFGAAGQRCMAISAAVFVGPGSTERYRQALVDKAKSLKVWEAAPGKGCAAWLVACGSVHLPVLHAEQQQPAPPAHLPTCPQVSAGWEAGAEVGPVISPQAKQRIERLVESGIQQVCGVLCCVQAWPGPAVAAPAIAFHHSRACWPGPLPPFLPACAPANKPTNTRQHHAPPPCRGG